MNMTQKEFIEDALANPRKYIGQLCTDSYGNVYMVERIDTAGLKVMPVIKKLVGG